MSEQTKEPLSNLSNINNIHQEIHFEDDICDYLLAHGWIGGDKNPDYYDAKLALIPSDALRWIQTIYPQDWQKLVAAHGNEGASALFIRKLTENLDSQGSLSVFRQGFKMVGTGSTMLAMASFKPAFELNPDEVTKYNANRCRIVRQVHFSPYRTAESIDLVLFLNGIPVATLELKTESTQSVYAAIRQYRTDRPPVDPTTRNKEPLLQFKTRCLVHFAVSTEEVHMSTHLMSKDTSFLPFNMGYNEGKGNPPNPNGIKTAYLWKNVFQRDHWLHILGQFVHLKMDKDGKKDDVIIFPRYHQWDVVKSLVETVRNEGAGKRYLIQHSAGSGKSNSIAWLSYHLSNLHRSGPQGEVKVFDSVIIVTDRTVLDKQLSDTIYQFEHKHGVVEWITNKEGSKSSKLGAALTSHKPIIIVTIQTFGYVLEYIANDLALKDRTFAIVVDEAHTSQTGKASTKLKQALTHDDSEDEENSTEDILLAHMEAQAENKNLSYFAFTATPKAKTMELFGRRDTEGVLHPFHSYSMQQAIEEGYILDVLQNYTSYKVAWKLAHDGKDYDDTMVDKSEAAQKLVRWVRLHPYNIAQKVAVIVEHFRENVSFRLNGEAKAMVVTSSRQEVIRYKEAIDKYIKDHKYPLATIVAFSGEVHDSGKNYTEKNMNPSLKQSISKSFDEGPFQFLLVANKFQTGFDQPKLVAMYLDKKLGGVATVQTLSRLNRTYPGKDWTIVLDFVNAPGDILADFQVYYRAAQMPGGSDPELLLKLQLKLDADGFYLKSEVDAFANFYWNPKSFRSHTELHKLITPSLQRVRDRYKTALQAKDTKAIDVLMLLVKDVKNFCKLYEFLSQILDYADTDLPKRYFFFKHLLHPLIEILRESPDEQDKIDLSGVKLTHLSIKSHGDSSLVCSPTENPYLTGISALGTAKLHNKDKERLSEIIERLNDIFEGELSDGDQLSYTHGVVTKLMESETLSEQATNNTKSQFSQGSILEKLNDAVIENQDANNKIATQLQSDEGKFKAFSEIVIDMLWDAFEKKRKLG